MGTSVRIGLAVVVLVLLTVSGWWVIKHGSQANFVSPLASEEKNAKISQYSFPALQDRKYEGGQIKLEKLLEQQGEFRAYMFAFTSDGKRVTGQINIPKEKMPKGGFPVVLMIRGYVDETIYETGVGTKNAAAVFAKNGYVTLAPDFLGYGGSDKQDNDMLVSRFENPVVVLNLMASLPSLKEVNLGKLAMWGHSNGGQVAISVLEISRQAIPTTLWAPVSQPFPYSVLHYAAELPDEGAILKQAIADFERNFNPSLFSITAFLDQIEGPIQLHQGGADEAVPREWSEALVSQLKMAGKDVTYYVYPDADHNLKPAWNTVVARDVNFFQKHLAGD